jgi:hypothetical protein
MVEAVVRPTSLTSYGGWVAWSRYDPAHHAYQLMTSSPTGQITPVGIAESPQEFEVDLGPLRSGAVGAVFSRCANAAHHKGCRLEEVDIGSGTPDETRLSVPGGGSLFRPALWGATIAFLRVVPHGGERHPVELFEWTSGSKGLKAFALPRNKISREDLEFNEEEHQATYDGYTGDITSLTLNGTRVAYTRVAPYTGCCSISDLWVQRPGRMPKQIDNAVTGQAATFGKNTYLTPEIVGPWLYTYRQYYEPGGADGELGWVRFNLATGATQQAQVAFEDNGGSAAEREVPEGQVLSAVVPQQAGVAWILHIHDDDEYPASVLSLPAVKWKTIKRRERERE